MQVRMIASHHVDGTRRRAGDFVDTTQATGERLVADCLATTVAGDGERRNARPVSPNRMKFASLVGALDPKDPDFAEQVSTLQAEYEARMLRIGALQAMINGTVDCDGPHKALDYDKEAVAGLKAALEAAIERFVVDRY